MCGVDVALADSGGRRCADAANRGERRERSARRAATDSKGDQAGQRMAWRRRTADQERVLSGTWQHDHRLGMDFSRTRLSPPLPERTCLDRWIGGDLVARL